MLPNHSPLTIAEQFGTLATIHPGRVDLGLGRAPGTDQRTAAALRRHMGGGVDSFPQDVMELQHYFGPPPEDVNERGYVRAIPGEGTGVPLYILGSSLYGAELAAALGLPFAFASHFAPEQLVPAMAIYRNNYRPSAANPKPHAIATVNVIAADDSFAANYLFTSLQQHFLRIGGGRPGPLEPPLDDISQVASVGDLARLRGKLGGTVVGDPREVAEGLAQFRARSGADELLLTALIYDHEARCRSFEIAKDVVGAMS